MIHTHCRESLQWRETKWLDHWVPQFGLVSMKIPLFLCMISSASASAFPFAFDKNQNSHIQVDI